MRVSYASFLARDVQCYHFFFGKERYKTWCKGMYSSLTFTSLISWSEKFWGFWFNITAKIWCFPLRISSVNVTKSAVYGFKKHCTINKSLMENLIFVQCMFFKYRKERSRKLLVALLSTFSIAAASNSKVSALECRYGTAIQKCCNHDFCHQNGRGILPLLLAPKTISET